MGAGASVQIDETTSNILKEETMKPLDASDVATPRGESAKAEVIRLRALIAENAKKTEAPAAQQSKQPLIEIQGDTTTTCLARVEEALKLNFKEQSNIIFINGRLKFLKYKSSELTLVKTDSHPNGLAHKVISDNIIKLLTKIDFEYFRK